MVGIGGELKAALRFRTDAVLSHEMTYPLYAHAESARLKLAPHSGPAVLVFGLSVNDADLGDDAFIA
jgi:hypothetical protein